MTVPAFFQTGVVPSTGRSATGAPADDSTGRCVGTTASLLMKTRRLWSGDQDASRSEMNGLPDDWSVKRRTAPVATSTPKMSSCDVGSVPSMVHAKKRISPVGAPWP